ncbi:MAG: SirB2 family protein [Woeseiaceae bacterium]
MIKFIHMSTAFISITFFIIRGIWVFRDSPMDAKRLAKKWVKILPHVNDTVLLISAIILAVGLHQYPFTHDWLTAKFIALLLYIVLGSFALKRAKEKRNKIIFFILAIFSFSYIVSVALTRTVVWVF